MRLSLRTKPVQRERRFSRDRLRSSLACYPSELRWGPVTCARNEPAYKVVRELATDTAALADYPRFA